MGLADIVFLSLLTVQRNRVWMKETTFREQTVTCAPASAKAWMNLGLAYERDLKPGRAEQSLKTALDLAQRGNPALDRYGVLYRAHGNLGMVMLKQRRYREASLHLQEALRLHSGYAPAARHLGMLIMQCRTLAEQRAASGDVRGAAEMYHLLLRVDPRSAPAYREALHRFQDDVESQHQTAGNGPDQGNQ